MSGRQTRQSVPGRRSLPSPVRRGGTNVGACSGHMEAVRGSMPSCRQPWVESVTFWHIPMVAGRTPRDPMQAGSSMPYTGPFNFEAMVPWTVWAVPQEVGRLYTGSIYEGY